MTLEVTDEKRKKILSLLNLDGLVDGVEDPNQKLLFESLRNNIQKYVGDLGKKEEKYNWNKKTSFRHKAAPEWTNEEKIIQFDQIQSFTQEITGLCHKYINLHTPNTNNIENLESITQSICDIKRCMTLVDTHLTGMYNKFTDKTRGLKKANKLQESVNEVGDDMWLMPVSMSGDDLVTTLFKVVKKLNFVDRTSALSLQILSEDGMLNAIKAAQAKEKRDSKKEIIKPEFMPPNVTEEEVADLPDGPEVHTYLELETEINLCKKLVVDCYCDNGRVHGGDYGDVYKDCITCVEPRTRIKLHEVIERIKEKENDTSRDQSAFLIELHKERQALQKKVDKYKVTR